MNPQAPNQQQPYPAPGYAYGPQQPGMPPQPQMQMPPQGVPHMQQRGPGPRQMAPQSNPNSTQNTLQIAEIRDGIVIMNDGTYRSVIMVKSINFDLMSPNEQEAVEYAYQGFLNSLYFPVQIFLRSQKVDIGPYIERLDKIRTEHDNMLLALLMEDYINYIDVLAHSTNIMDKKFYVVVPYASSPTQEKALESNKSFITGVVELFSKKEQHVVINERELEKAKTELRNRVQAVMGGLMQCGIKSLPLDTEELIELYYETYNPDTATRQHIKNFEDLTADVVTKGEGAAPRSHLQGELPQ
jgi:type IV secretory pathway VirB4 component